MKSPHPRNEAAFWKKRLGRHGERLVMESLSRQGWQVDANNWHDGKKGEIDIICRDPQGLLVFLEVKTRCYPRAQAGFQTEGFDAITPRKKQKIVTSARSYLAQRDLLKVPYRFDVAVVTFFCDQPRLDMESLPEPVITHVHEAIGGF